MIGSLYYSKTGYCEHPNIDKEVGEENVSIYRLSNCPKNNKVKLKDDWRKNSI